MWLLSSNLNRLNADTVLVEKMNNFYMKVTWFKAKSYISTNRKNYRVDFLVCVNLLKTFTS